MNSVTKIAPATPLPWQMGQQHSSGNGDHYNGNTIFPANADLSADSICQVYGVPINHSAERLQKLALAEPRFAHGYQNAAYIVHAANAYPKLVEALRQYVDLYADLPIGKSGCGRFWEQARALLRSLGEAE